ncbi:hypothetical protein H6G45_06485 [Synechocystis sp. FACHB-383]|uniref:hypothetical protein n=1 Tax=Synechocystis sp. FACHB-383 TaxID=2692864 RepID=UPI001683EC7E|nr:hypothetical protein [Synechocystis sp. FACHB-383]MBD2653140.1 hypothetical protein [Synechocystis sp. FACHB-383]
MTKQVFHLFRRCHRLYRRLEESRGTQMNLRWYRWVDILMETYDEIESLGIDVESSPWLVNLKPTPESESIAATLKP